MTPSATTTRRAVIARLRRQLRGETREFLYRLDLNNALRVFNVELVGIGVTDGALVSPKTFFRGAIISGASSVVVVHSHPNESSAPSSDDFEATRDLIAAGRLLDIGVCEHVIIGSHGRPYFMRRATRGSRVARSFEWSN